ncbi:MAG: hypothetical protein WC334_07450 [Kiritimatiellales bacterium]|jgi:hypothetical protein
MKKQELNDLIRVFALKQSKTFEFERLVQYVEKRVQGDDDDDRLYEAACASEWLFGDDREMFTEGFMPRHVFFKGAEFRVTPLDEEVEGGFLVPGHRFVPFISREVFPAEAILKLPDGSVAPTRTVSIPYPMAGRCLLFFGQYGTIDYLICDHESNAERLKPPVEEPLELTVFDLRSFFESGGFQAGDSLMLKVEDWQKGVFSVRHVPSQQAPLDFAATHGWVQALRNGFKEACLEADLGHDCYEQTARMLRLASADEDAPPVLCDPPLSLAAFFNMQKDLKVQTAGQTSFFWPDDEPLDSRMVNSLENGVCEPETELDACFEMLGLSMNSSEAEAYMRDALSRGEKNPDGVLARVISGRTLYFPTADDQREFYRLWQELWTGIQKTYVAGKDRHREMRSVFLDLNDQCLRVLRELDRDSADPFAVMMNPAAMQLHELSSLISSALAVCNRGEEDAGEFSMPLDEMAGDMSAAIEDLSKQLQGKPAKKKKSGKKRKNDSSD